MRRHLEKLNVKRLEYVFDPHGLPLIAKSAPDLFTTSLLVRGGPGTGKTTLALALGQALAADGEGALVYLTTEFSPAEVLYKAELLGLHESQVSLRSLQAVRESENPDITPGAILVDNVVGPTPEDAEVPQPLEASRAKKLFILESAWNKLGLGDDDARPTVAGIPVRALVIDAFILPDFGRDDAEVRSDLVAFIQALEGVGVTPILVEEVAPDSPSWLPFLVDVVFELAHRAAAEGHLERTLTCPKSRYGIASAGPHLYALQEKQPALFPTARHALVGIPGVQNRLCFALSVPGPRWTSFRGQQVITDESEAGDLLNLLLETPGAVPISVRFGFPCTITGPDILWQVDESLGPSAVGWAIIDAVSKAKANLVTIRDLSRVARREWWRLPVEQILDALRMLGVVTVVHDNSISVSQTLAAVVDISYSSQLQIIRGDTVRSRPLQLVDGLRSPARKPSMPFTFSSIEYFLEPSPAWLLVCAWIAGNTAALDPLEDAIASDPGGLAHLAFPLLRARARWQSLEDADACVDRLTSRMSWVETIPGIVARTRAELRLDSDDPSTVDEGITRLRDVLASYALQPEHRAEILYNIAVALELRRDYPGAIEALSESLAHDATLEVAQAMMSRLNPTRPSPVTSS